MFTELCKCQALFTKFGGHRQAAGVSLKEENVQRFRETINSLCTLTEEDLQMKVYIDMQVPFPYLTEDLIEQFQVMEQMCIRDSIKTLVLQILPLLTEI